jgi:two-component sensor histidine kinase
VELVAAAGPGGDCVLTISDTGPGFVAMPVSKRHGIGLVRRLAEQIGGSATLAAPPGACWTIRFPAVT